VELGRTQVTAGDGVAFDALLATPDSGTGPGLVLFQEIFGVGPYIEAVAERLTGLGYVVLAPDLFWRIEPNLVLPHDEGGLVKAMETAQQFDPEAGLADCDAALAHVRSLPEVTGGAGVIGFCFGGTLAFQVAARSSPDAAVSYYGSGVPDSLALADRITCPLLLHFGGDDPYLPAEQVEAVRLALAGRAGVELHVHEGAGHAFDNHEAPAFHQPDAAATAWAQTTDFLRRTLPV